MASTSVRPERRLEANGLKTTGNNMAERRAVGEKLAAVPLFLIRNERKLRVSGELLVAPATSLDLVMKLASCCHCYQSRRQNLSCIHCARRGSHNELRIDSISIIIVCYAPCAPIRDAEHDRAEAKAVAS
jgi:hypothetical protein